MTTVPGFSADASLGSRRVARGRRLQSTDSRRAVVPAASCEATCFIKLVDCVLAHEMNCQSRHWWCKFWCRYGPAT